MNKHPRQLEPALTTKGEPWWILCYYCGKQNKINLEKTIDTGKAMCFNCKAEFLYDLLVFTSCFR